MSPVGLSGYIQIVGHGPDVTTVQVPQAGAWPTNYCPNPTLETNITGWGTTTAFGEWTEAGYEQSNVHAHGGTYSIRANWATPTTPSHTEVVGYQTSALDAGTYRFGVWVYVPSGSPDVRLDAFLYQGSEKTSVKDAWVRLEVSFTAAQGAQVFCYVKTEDASAGTYCYIDDAETKRVSDIALPPSRLKTRSLAQATETDTGQPVTRSRVYTLAQATETDTAQTIEATQPNILGQASTVQSALTITRVRTRAIAQATDTETAQPVAHVRTYPLARANETDTGLHTSRVLGVKQAQETDTGLAIPRPVGISLAIAAETDTARLLLLPTIKFTTYNLYVNSPDEDTYDDLMYLIGQGAVVLGLQEVGQKHTVLTNVCNATGYQVDYSINTAAQDAILWDPNIVTSEAEGDYQISPVTDVTNPTATIGVRYVTWRRFHPLKTGYTGLSFTFGVIHFINRPNMSQSRNDLMLTQAAASADWGTSLNRVYLTGDFNEDTWDSRWDAANGLRTAGWHNNGDEFGEIITFPDPTDYDRSFDQFWYRAGTRLRALSQSTYDGSSDHHALTMVFEMLTALQVALPRADVTTSAFPVTRLKTKAVPQAVETDTAQQVGDVHRLALASHTTTAQPVTKTRTRILALAAETDTAQPVGDVRYLARANETDTAQAVTKQSGTTLAIATQTTTAQPVTRVRTYPLAQATETDTTQAVTRAKVKTPPLPSETDSAQAVTVVTGGEPVTITLAQAGYHLRVTPALLLDYPRSRDTAQPVEVT